MTYEEAIKESLNRKWVVATCAQGEKCWCRVINCDPPVMYMEEGEEYEYSPVDQATANKEVVEHIVKLHNDQDKNRG